MRLWTKLNGRALTVVTVTGAAVMVGALPSYASTPLPVQTVAGTNFNTPDPGVFLGNNHFWAFATGSGLKELDSPIAAGQWTTPAKTLSGGLPSWADPSGGIWAPDMIKTSSGTYVVYFAAVLGGIPSGSPPGMDLAPASGSRCIGTAEGTSPGGPFTADERPLVCFDQYNPVDGMDANPGDRTRGEGVIGAAPVIVTIGGQQELFLLYKTQGDPGSGEATTIRMVQLSMTNGITKIVNSKQLLKSGTGTFADTIEAPSLIQHGGSFFLFVAHGNFDKCAYETQWYKSSDIWTWTGSPTTILSQGLQGLCGPGTADVTDSEVAGQSRIFFNGWVNQQADGTITCTPYNGTKSISETNNADRVMYAAVINWSASNTPQLGAFQGQSSC